MVIEFRLPDINPDPADVPFYVIEQEWPRAAAHDCGMCDKPSLVPVEAHPEWWVCSRTLCQWSHTSRDCCAVGVPDDAILVQQVTHPVAADHDAIPYNPEHVAELRARRGAVTT